MTGRAEKAGRAPIASSDVTPARRRSLVVGAAAGLLLAAVIVGAIAISADRDDAGPTNALADATAPQLKGKRVPTDALKRFDGSTFTLADYRGMPLVVNFWAASCAPCVKEMPAFEQVHQQLKDRVRFLGIQVQEDAEDGLAMISRTGVTYDVAQDRTGQFAVKVKATLLPTSLWVSADGKVLDTHLGALTADELMSKITKAFGVKPAP